MPIKLPQKSGFALLPLIFFSCVEGNRPAPAGGQLPTNYIIIKDSSFSPNVLSLVSGSSITFVNNTAIAHTIASQDSTYIKPVKIESGTSYFLKKDTVGSIVYKCLTHPGISGTINFLP